MMTTILHRGMKVKRKTLGVNNLSISYGKVVNVKDKILVPNQRETKENKRNVDNSHSHPIQDKSCSQKYGPSFKKDVPKA